MSHFVMHVTWGDDDQGNYGPGVSRPKDGQQTKEFRVRVELPDAKPLTWITRAPNKKEALKYAKNRWPRSTCSVLQ